MALHTELPVYRDTYKLVLEIFVSTKNFPKEYKYSLGRDMERDVLVLMRCIYRANRAQEKTAFLNEFLDNFEILKLEKMNTKLSQRIQNQENVFKEYVEMHFPRIVRNGDICSSWFNLCKRINQNSYYCLYCGSYMGIGPIVSLLSYYDNSGKYSIPNYHIDCIKCYKKKERKRKKITLYNCPLTNKTVIGFERLNI